MDFSKLKMEATNTLHLKHPVTFEPLFTDSDVETGKRPEVEEDEVLPDGVAITISGYGQDSNEYRKVQADQMRKIANIKNPKKRQAIASDFKAQGFELLTKIVSGFTGIVVDGESLPFCIENVERFFNEWPWAKEQWDEFVHERENFLPKR